MKHGAVILRGTVVGGDSYGRTIGFPTANLSRRGWVRLLHKPRLGIWAGWVHIESDATTRYPAGIVIGPCDAAGLPKLEAHLLNFTGNLYGQKLTFVLAYYLHSFRVYKNEQLLRAGIAKDVALVRRLIV